MADDKEDHPESPEVHFEPLVNLPPVDVKSLEEEEEEFVKLRAKLFRYDSSSEPPEWKERGTGDVKILKHKGQGTVRVLMRRDKTLKICANHYVMPFMELKTNCGSDRAWVWSTPADFADEETRPELLAIRFANVENAQKFKEKFELAKKVMSELSPPGKKDSAKEKEDEEKSEKEGAKPDASDDASEGETTTKSDKDTEDVAEKLQEMSVKDGKPATAESTTEKSSPEKSDDQAER